MARNAFLTELEEPEQITLALRCLATGQTPKQAAATLEVGVGFIYKLMRVAMLKGGFATTFQLMYELGKTGHKP